LVKKVTVYALNPSLVPDFNHDGKQYDDASLTSRTTFSLLDHDETMMKRGTSIDNDKTQSRRLIRTPDYNNSHWTPGDLLDFFPVWLDIIRR
jgi:hypothetical protein